MDFNECCVFNCNPLMLPFLRKISIYLTLHIQVGNTLILTILMYVVVLNQRNELNKCLLVEYHQRKRHIRGLKVMNFCVGP